MAGRKRTPRATGRGRHPVRPSMRSSTTGSVFQSWGFTDKKGKIITDHLAGIVIPAERFYDTPTGRSLRASKTNSRRRRGPMAPGRNKGRK